MSRAALPLILLAVATIYGLYRLSYAFEHLQHELTRYNHRILANRQEIAVLHAEWSYLSRPAEIARLTALYMPDLKPISVKQIIKVGDLARLPARFASAPTPSMAPTLGPPKGGVAKGSSVEPTAGGGAGLRLAERIMGTGLAPAALRPSVTSGAGSGR